MRDCPNGTRTREFGPFSRLFQKSGLFLEYVAGNSYLPRRILNAAPGWAPRPHALTYAGSFAAAPPPDRLGGFRFPSGVPAGPGPFVRYPPRGVFLKGVGVCLNPTAQIFHTRRNFFVRGGFGKFKAPGPLPLLPRKMRARVRWARSLLPEDPGRPQALAVSVGCFWLVFGLFVACFPVVFG